MSLDVRGLRVCAGNRTLLDDVSLHVAPGEFVVVAGPSGSGKSLLLRAILDLVPARPGRVGGAVFLDGQQVHPRSLRGDVVGIVAQDARGSLDPLSTVATSISHAARLGRRPAQVRDTLARVGFDAPSAVARLYPHELSGGMAQRAAIAVALARGSRFLLCDEPTTGLDPHVQVEIVALLRGLGEQGVVFVTHDLDLVDGTCDRVHVLDGGRVVDRAPRPSALQGAGEPLWSATAALRRRRA